MSHSILLRASAAAFPAVFVVHDIAEALQAARADESLGRLLGRASPRAAALFERRLRLEEREYLAAAAGAFALGAAAAWPVVARPRRGPALTFFTAAVMLRLANSLVHAVETAAPRDTSGVAGDAGGGGAASAPAPRLSPGAASALALGLPYCLLTLRALSRAGLATPGELLRALVLGAALMPAAAVTLRLGARLAGERAGAPVAGAA